MAKLPIPNRTRTESALLIPRTSRERWPELLALAGLTLILGVTAGLIGIGAGVITAAVWYRSGVPFSIAIGHLLLIVVFPDGLTRITLLLVESAFFVLLVFPFVRTSVPFEATMIGGLATFFLFGFGWVGFQATPLWLVGILCPGLITLGLYIVYRHGLVTLGIVPQSESDDRTRTETTQTNHE